MKEGLWRHNLYVCAFDCVCNRSFQKGAAWVKEHEVLNIMPSSLSPWGIFKTILVYQVANS